MDSNIFFILYSISTITIITISILLTAFIFKKFKFVDQIVLFKIVTAKELIGLAVTISLTLICWLFNTDVIFKNMSFVSLLFYISLVSLCCHGIYNLNLIQKILKFLELI